MVVEVDSETNTPRHNVVSPISLLQNSPLYSPVKDSPCSPSPSLSLTVFPQSEDRTSPEPEEKSSPWSVNDRDEGIESEEEEHNGMESEDGKEMKCEITTLLLCWK